MNSMEASLIVFSCVFGGGLPAPVPVRRRGPNTASPFLAFGDSVPIGRVKPAARDRRSGRGRMRNGCNARELRAFFRGFAQELGNRQEHVTCWLCRQSQANRSPEGIFPVRWERTGNLSENRVSGATDVAKKRDSPAC